MKKVIVTLLLLGLFGGGGYSAYHYVYLNYSTGESGRVSSDSEDAVHVDALAMIAGLNGGNGLTDRYGGETVAQATLDVKLENDRKVKTCYVKEGQLVKKGQKLFLYDTADEQDRLEQAEIDIERTKTKIEQGKRSIETLEKEKKNADKEQQLEIVNSILLQENENKQDEYDIKAKEREMERLKETMENSTVFAEMEGIIQKINDSNDEEQFGYYGGSSDDSAYITILATGDFRIQAKINEQNMNNIYEGMPMIIFSRIDPDRKWYGMISSIDTDKPTEDDNEGYYWGNSGADSSTYKFYVELDDSEGLMLGQHVYMEADIGQEEEREGIWLEEYYIVQDEEESFVWKANSSNRIEKQIVQLGQYDEDRMEYEILSGLNEEDYIAFPMDTIEEGAPVAYNDQADSEMFGDFGDFPEYDELPFFGDFDDDSIGFFENGEVFEEDDDQFFIDDDDDGDIFDADNEEFYFADDDDEDDFGDEDWNEEDGELFDIDNDLRGFRSRIGGFSTFSSREDFEYDAPDAEED